MGILTDLIIAGKSEAETISHSLSPIKEWQGFDGKGHNEITLGHLLCILRDEEFSEAVWTEFPLVAQASDDGPWVFALPDDLAVKLNQLNKNEIPVIAAKWLTNNDDMKNFQNDHAQNFIEELKLLASESISHQKSILMWMSL